MRKIINGRKYDTDTATRIAEWENTIDVRDFSHYSETLYRKRNGEYFIFGSGNAGSRYSTRVEQNTWSGGQNIAPLSYDAAREWAETHLDADTYETEFGDVSEGGDGDVMIGVRVPVAIKAAFDRYCVRVGRTKSDVLTELIATLGQS